MKKLRADTVTAMASTTIACFALFISVWHGAETRKHNKFSVTPSVGLTLDMRREAKKIGIFISSDGLGPAIVGDVVISVGKKQHDLNSQNGVMGALTHLRINEPWIQWRWIEKGSYLPKGKTVFLIQADRGRIDSLQEARLKIAISQMKVRIKYSSIYGEGFQEEAVWLQ